MIILKIICFVIVVFNIKNVKGTGSIAVIIRIVFDTVIHLAQLKFVSKLQWD